MHTLVSISIETLIVGLIGTAVLAAPNAIVPGHSIGQVRLGETFDTVTRALKQPTGGGDTAMGRSWQIWGGVPSGPNAEDSMGREPFSLKMASKAELDVYTDIYAHFPDGRPNPNFLALVEQVRVTSPWFRTASGVGVGSCVSQLLAVYPRLKRVDQMDASAPHKVGLYDDETAGIAFQVVTAGPNPAMWRCVAVTIHPRGRGVLDEYGGYYWW